MNKKLLSMLLCLCMALTLLPTAAWAADYPGWDNSQTYSVDDTITIGGKSYTYKSDVTSVNLDLTGTNTPTAKTIYKAGDGYVLFTPADGTTTPATLTLNSAATTGDITLTGEYKFVLKGTNRTGNIFVNQKDGFGTGTLTIAASTGASLSATYLSADSVTGDMSALNAITNTFPSTANSNDYDKVMTFYGTCNVPDGTLTAPSFVVDEGATATVSSASNDPVTLTAATGFTNKGTLTINAYLVKITTTSGGFTNEGTINIIDGYMLDLSGCPNVVSDSIGSIVNNGNLGLPAGFPVANIDMLRLTGNGVVTINGVTYSKLNGKWMQNVTNKGLDLSTNAPSVETTYKAGTGTVTFTPATTDPVANAKLTFNGATISASGHTAVNLPDEAVDVTFRGTNSISASAADGDVRAFAATTGAVTFTLDAGSTTTLTARGNLSKVISSGSNVTINGSGALNLNPKMNEFATTSDGYAIHTTGNVTINGGSVCEQRVINSSTTVSQSGTGGIEAGTVTLGAVTIPAGGTLDLYNASIAAAPTKVINNGTLILPSDKEFDYLSAIGDIGGVIVVGGVSYKFFDGAWRRDVTATGLDISTRPTVETVYTAGEGTITFTKADSTTTTATLTLNNATIALASQYGDTYGAALVLGEADINLVLEGSSSLKGFENMAMCGDTDEEACGAVTIGGNGSLTLNGKKSEIGSFCVDTLTLTDSATVSSPDGTVTGTVTVGSDATINAVLKVGTTSKRTVYGKHTIAENEEKYYTDSVLAWDDDAGIEVNGVLTLANGTVFDTVKSHLTGSGIVCIMKSDAEIKNNQTIYADYGACLIDGTPMKAYKNGLLFNLPVTDQGANWKKEATLQADGYEFKGNSTDGYTLTLGNLCIMTTGNNAIKLPNDGPVNVVLKSGTYTYLYTTAGVSALFCGSDGGAEYPVTISGSGRLLVKGDGLSLQVSAPHPLIISGGDIRAYSETMEAVTASNLTITGGTLTVGTKSSNRFAFSTAPKFTGYIPRVTYGEDATSATTELSPKATVYTNNKYVKIEKYVASSGGGGAGTFTLTFDVNGGSAVDKVTKPTGTTVDLSAYVPTRVGYTFVGWFSDESLTDKVTAVKLTKSMTVYAKWSEAANRPFTDVTEDDWFYGDVAYVFTEGLMQGTGETTFNPHGTTSRGMIVTILYRLVGEPDLTGDSPFGDVEAGKYYENAVIWAAENKIVDGYDNGRFGPEDSITREQLATILYRYAQYKGYDVSVGEDTNILSYNDAIDIAEYAIPAMQWACGAGLINGSDGNLMPQGGAERCQVAAILHRFCGNVK